MITASPTPVAAVSQAAAAATGVGEAVIIAGANGYLSLAKSDHKRGGITFESAKANNFVSSDEESRDSPAI